MDNRYKYILSTIEKEYTVDMVLRESETVMITSYIKNNGGNKIVLIVGKNLNENVLKRLIGDKSAFLPEIYDVCSDGDETLVLEEYIAVRR